jgi:polyisoprenoid-binding protein YceI
MQFTSSFTSPLTLRVASIILGSSAFVVSLAPMAALGASAPVAGQRCTQPQKEVAIAGQPGRLRCAKSGSKLVWIAAVPAIKAPSNAASKAKSLPADTSALVGTWRSSAGSQAGYRMREIFAGGAAKTDAVGRTSAVDASVVFEGNNDGVTLRSVKVVADLTAMKSDRDKRDEWLQTAALQTNTFPTASFEMTEPMTFRPPKEGQVLTLQVRGRLTVHGVTNQVAVMVEARRTGDIIDLVGSTRLTLADYQIETPMIPGFVSTDDTGLLEFLLVLRR